MKEFKEFLEIIGALIGFVALVGTLTFMGYSAFYAIQNSPNKTYCTHQVIKPQ